MVHPWFAGPGSLFKAIIGDQFIQRRKKWQPPASSAKSGDRLRVRFCAACLPGGGVVTRACYPLQAAGILPGTGEKQGSVFSTDKAGKKTKMAAIEWLHQQHSRSVMVIVDETPAAPTIGLQKVRGGLLRLIGQCFFLLVGMLSSLP